MNRGRRLGEVGGLAAIAAATLVLQLLAGESLTPPPVTSWGAFDAWLAQREPLVATFACLRMLALVVAWYLVAATAVGIALRLAHARSLVRVADRLTVPPLRRLLAGMLSAGLLSSGGLGGTASPGFHPGVAMAASITASGGGDLDANAPASSQSGQSEGEGVDDEITMRRLEPGEPASQQIEEHSAVSTEWTVAPGQSFWSIAEAVLTEARAQAPTDAEIVPYWQRLIEANRPSLADPANPDLIFSGQRFVVPPP